MLKNILVLDTETAGDFRAPMVYDFGFVIADLHGNILYKFSTVIAETFLDRKLMHTAYYEEKVPMYNRDIRNGKRACMSFLAAYQLFNMAVEKWGVKEIYAYNISFDIRALNNTARKLAGMEFFNDKMVLRDIWSIASISLMSSMKYFDFAVSHNLLTEKGNLKTSAEACFQFLTDDAQFIEDHTALEDAEIEYEILLACKRKKKKLVDNLSQPWRVVNKLAREKGVLE